MADAEIEIVPYDTEWPARFLAERQLLEATLARWLAGPIEHIGSTAVPGLAAKPVIDIMAPVRGLDESRDAIAAAEAVGYMHYPYKPHEMHWFCKPSPALRTHHLHIVEAGSRTWGDRLLWRDLLRQDPALRQAYEALKRRLAVAHRHDREAYTDAKAGFIDAAIARAQGTGTGTGTGLP